MKKLPFFLVSFLFSVMISNAQEIKFEEYKHPNLNDFFKGVRYGSSAFADIDNDGDQDVLITGTTLLSQRIAELYTNNNGIFSLVSDTPFSGVWVSSIAFEDIDGDGDQDVLITGEDNPGQGTSKLYTNNGVGIFTLVPNTPFEGVWGSSIAFSDIDNDGDQDVLITGRNGSNIPRANLYKNDGTGTFTLVNNTSFVGVYYGSITFADVDNDNDQDVLITGYNIYGGTSKLYKNDGIGEFSLVGTPFDGVGNSSVAFADIDNDGDQDVLITGSYYGGGRTKLYKNDGAGLFSLVIETPFDGVAACSIKFADTDDDGDKDVLITGTNNDNQIIAKLYINNGAGVFTLVPYTPFAAVFYGSVSFADIDNDSDQDVLITGWDITTLHVARLYTNNGGVFAYYSGPYFEEVYGGSAVFSDINGDNFLDVLITGSFGNATEVPPCFLYTNDENGAFTLVQDSPFIGNMFGNVAFADIDKDGDQDVLITGKSESGLLAQLYTNNGKGKFALVTTTPFEGIYWGSIAFADIDKDGDQDVLITGNSSLSSIVGIAKLYRNEGNYVFTLVTGTPFEGVNDSSIAFADIDKDGDQDVLITGVSNSGLIAQLYTNDGSGGFTLVSGTPFEGVSGSSVAFSDTDNDGYPDVLITGRNSLNEPLAKLYSNNGDDTFTFVPNPAFVGVYNGSIAFADVDKDGDQDVMITGLNSSDSNAPITKLYINNNCTGEFMFVQGTPFDYTGVHYSSIAFADIDNDGDQDILINGWHFGGGISKLFVNTSLTLTEKVTNIDANLSSTPVPFGTDANLSAFIDPPIEGIDVTFSFLDSNDNSINTYKGVTDNTGKASVLVSNLTIGVYKIKAAAGNECAQTIVFLPVYDPTAGFVTGGGWINSPAGAYAIDPTLAGKANFGFVSKYVKGKTLPTGTTEFQFHAAEMNFKSAVYEWLIVAGGKAQFKGSGTIDGIGDYGFMLTAIDGSTDKFRIKIWDKTTRVVFYDNQTGAADNADPSTAISGGSIVIHTPATKSAKIYASNEPLAEQSGLKVYPNPFTDILQFEIVSSADTFATINIFDVTGRHVDNIFEGPVKDGVYNLAKFIPQTTASSFYLYKITLGEKEYNGTVVYKGQ